MTPKDNTLSHDAGLILRPLTVSDIPACSALEHTCFAEPFSCKAYAEWLSSDTALGLVVECNGVIIGLITGVVIPEDAFVYNLAVCSSVRGKGIGHALVNCFIEEAQKRGATRVMLELRQSNETAARLYQKLGFETVGKRRDFYTSPKEDALLLTKFCKRKDSSHENTCN